MAKLYNLARMSTATTGTGTITLGSAVSGYLTFAQAGVSNADVVDYAIKDGANSEIGTGTYTSSGTTLTRTVTNSTNSNAAINLSGSAEVFISPRAATLNDASLITTGTISAARMGGGTADATTVLYGDNNFRKTGRVLLNTLTASSSAQLDDTTSLTSTYGEYEIVFENLVPATNATALQCLYQVSGTFQTSGYIALCNNLNTSGAGASSETTQIPITRSSGDLSSTAANGGYSGTARIYNPAGTSSAKLWHGTGGAFQTTTSNAGSFITSGYYNAATAVTGLRFKMASGNIASGVIRIYGV